MSGCLRLKRNTGSADVRYPGQVYELTILASGGVSNFSMV